MPNYPLPAPRTWEELQSGVHAWLSEQWGPDWQKRRCPYCENEAWKLGDALALPAAPRWPTRSQAAFQPMLQVVCVKCSHSVLLDARSIFEPFGQERPPQREQRPTMY
jgi:hypothetical protein